MSYAPGPHDLSILSDTTGLKLKFTAKLLELRNYNLIKYILEPGRTPMSEGEEAFKTRFVLRYSR